jgi:hypothetical protein
MGTMMALITCKECQASISDQAECCPHCGAPLRAVAPRPIGSINRPEAKGVTNGISGLITLGVLFMIFGGSYRDAALDWLNPPNPPPTLASLPSNSNDFATVVRNTGCESPYSDERKDELFNSIYRDHRMEVSGQIVTLENGRASLKVLPKSLLQDIDITFADKNVGYNLTKNSWITVSFRMRSAGGCFLPYSGDLGEVARR